MADSGAIILFVDFSRCTFFSVAYPFQVRNGQFFMGAGLSDEPNIIKHRRFRFFTNDVNCSMYYNQYVSNRTEKISPARYLNIIYFAVQRTSGSDGRRFWHTLAD